MLGKFFGTNNSIKSQIKFINSLNIDDDIKRSQIATVFDNSSPFKIIQRTIAIIFTILYVILISLATVANGMGMDYKAVIAIIAAFNLGMIILAILGFYFSGGAISSFKDTRINKD